MKNYDNELSGVLYKNDDKREGKRDPDYRGNAEINRQQYWVSAWVNSMKDGRKYMSLKFAPKQAKDVRGAVAHKEIAAADDDLDGDIPFAVAALVPLGGMLAYAASTITALFVA